MSDFTCKLLVIGGGPGGYVCAIRAGQLGVDTVLVERNRLGGTCLNVGCIPSKALIHAADEYAAAKRFAGGSIGITAGAPVINLAETVRWMDGIVGRLTSGVGSLLKKAKVRVIEGSAVFRDGKTVEVTAAGGEDHVIRAEHVVIATGSAPIELADIPFGGSVISSTEALALQAVPERLVVVGAGYIGLEIGTAFRKLGAEVTVVEALDRILPQYDRDLTEPVAKRLAALGIEVLTDAKATGISDNGLAVQDADGNERRLQADKILVTVGRRPLTSSFGLEDLALEMNGAAIRIDERCHTSMREVYAIGDVSGEPMLAHRAMAQGEMVAEIVAGERRTCDKRCIPAICFTDPEVVTAGLNPEDAGKTGHEVKVGTFPFRANGRAMTMERDDGWIRIVARADNDLVLGIQAVGHGVAELASEFSLAIEMGATLEDIAASVHPHPSLGEAVQEAAMRALDRGIHL
jgi:dihydrolipoamide dehydrogenase